jgi:hypothetical protein
MPLQVNQEHFINYFLKEFSHITLNRPEELKDLRLQELTVNISKGPAYHTFLCI